MGAKEGLQAGLASVTAILKSDMAHLAIAIFATRWALKKFMPSAGKYIY